jgi:hypothetical protein
MMAVSALLGGAELASEISGDSDCSALASSAAFAFSDLLGLAGLAGELTFLLLPAFIVADSGCVDVDFGNSSGSIGKSARVGSFAVIGGVGSGISASDADCSVLGDASVGAGTGATAACCGTLAGCDVGVVYGMGFVGAAAGAGDTGVCSGALDGSMVGVVDDVSAELSCPVGVVDVVDGGGVTAGVSGAAVVDAVDFAVGVVGVVVGSGVTAGVSGAVVVDAADFAVGVVVTAAGAGDTSVCSGALVGVIGDGGVSASASCPVGVVDVVDGREVSAGVSGAAVADAAGFAVGVVDGSGVTAGVSGVAVVDAAGFAVGVAGVVDGSVVVGVSGAAEADCFAVGALDGCGSVEEEDGPGISGMIEKAGPCSGATVGDAGDVPVLAGTAASGTIVGDGVCCAVGVVEGSVGDAGDVSVVAGTAASGTIVGDGVCCAVGVVEGRGATAGDAAGVSVAAAGVSVAVASGVAVLDVGASDVGATGVTAGGTLVVPSLLDVTPEGGGAGATGKGGAFGGLGRNSDG